MKTLLFSVQFLNTFVSFFISLFTHAFIHLLIALLLLLAITVVSFSAVTRLVQTFVNRNDLNAFDNAFALVVLILIDSHYKLKFFVSPHCRQCLKIEVILFTPQFSRLF